MKKIQITINDLRQICLKTKNGLIAYEDMNIFQKIYFKLKLIKIKRKSPFGKLTINQLMQEKLEREDLSYNDYIKKYFSKGVYHA